MRRLHYLCSGLSTYYAIPYNMPHSLEYLIPRIALAEAKYIGPRYARLFLSRMGSVEHIFSSKEALKKAFPKQNHRLIEELYSSNLMLKAKSIAQWCVNEGVRVYFIGDEDYPYLLKQCPDAPVVLYCRGTYNDWKDDFCLSVVGTRNITSYGLQMTERLLREIKTLDAETLIVSGLAYGVDIAAHRKALDLGLPTVAVLAHGLDRVYPATHRASAESIARAGALITEYPPGTKPERYNFVGRNRIIAGLTKGTLIIEAGLRSGSLHTANMALDYGRELLAVPGRVGDKYSEGCNHLIASLSAALVTSGEDIIRCMGWERKGDTMQLSLQFEPDPLPIDNPVIAFIHRHQPVHMNDMSRQMGLSISELSAILFELELDGYIKSIPGGLYALA